MNSGDETSQGELVIYQTDDGRVKLDVRLQDESLWLTQVEMAELFQTTRQNIGQHIQNVFDEGEVSPDSTIKKFFIVQSEGNRQVQRGIDHYNLDVILSVGYRVKSLIATRFRIWATQRLREYIVKGFVMDDERLRNPPVEGSGVPDYFDEMLERIRDIRASERRMYLRVKDIFAMAADYEPSADDTRVFFSTIQNKLHHATTGMTGPEIVKSRADHKQPNMGLRTWKGDDIRKTDVVIGENYMTEDEISELNRIVTMWLDYSEDQAKRRKQVFMKDWAEKLDAFLEFNDRDVLSNAGKVSKQAAETHAKSEFDQFAKARREQKEALAEADYVKELEGIAKRLPTKSRGN